jgi:hypothetical protein
VSALAALTLLAAAQADPKVEGTFGAWSVRCPEASLDQFGTVQCEASATVSGIDIAARRDNERVLFTMTSPTCPGVAAEADAPRSSFDTHSQAFALGPRMIDGVLFTALSLKASECPAFATTLEMKRKDIDRAFDLVASHRKPKKRK